MRIGRRGRIGGWSQASRRFCGTWRRSRRRCHSGEGQHPINLRLGEGPESGLVHPCGIEANAGESEHEQGDERAAGFLLAVLVRRKHRGSRLGCHWNWLCFFESRAFQLGFRKLGALEFSEHRIVGRF
jgi:hypothetical protein